MRVRMMSLSAGPAGVRKPGDVVDVPDAEGRQLVRGGYAVPLASPPERAVATPPETAGGADPHATPPIAPDRRKRKGSN